MSTRFLNDLSDGHQAELFVAQVFERHGYKVIERASGRFPDWDIKILDRQGQEKTVEVKWDRKAHVTGNFFLERRCLEHSKADILIYCYGDPITHLYFMELPNTLVRLAPHQADTRGGDQQDYGWLFSKRKFQQILKPQIVNI